MLNRFDGKIESLIEAGALSEAPWDVYKSNEVSKRESEKMLNSVKLYTHLSPKVTVRMNEIFQVDKNTYYKVRERLEAIVEAGMLPDECHWEVVNTPAIRELLKNKETQLCPIYELDEIPTPDDILRTAIAEKFPHIPLDKPDFTKRKEIELEDLDVQVTPGTIFDQAVKQMVSPGISMEYIPNLNDTKYLADDAEFTKEMYDMFKNDSRERLADIEAQKKMDNGESEDMEPTPQQTDHMRHEDITTELYMIFDEKDSKYGKSFEQSVTEFGLVSAVIRMSDKMNRLKNIVMDEIDMGDNDESTRDTLLDLANYAILSVMQLDKWNEE